MARFVGEDIEATLRRIAPLPDGGRSLAETLAARNDVLYVRAVATSGALRGVKAAYGVRRKLAIRLARVSNKLGVSVQILTYRPRLDASLGQ